MVTIRRHLPSKFSRSGSVAALTALVFGATGMYFLAFSGAATFTAKSEAETGTLTTAATRVADTDASGDQSVKFGAASAGGGTGGFKANCINKPSDCGYPDATNTGVPAGTVLTNSGCVTVTTNNAVIQNLNIADCNITVKANNVTIKNTRIKGCTYYPIDYDEAYSGLVIQDSEIGGTCASVTASMSFSNYTCIRCNLYGGADGIKANSNVVLQDSYIHDLVATSGSHNDGIQSTSGSNVKVLHNTIATAPQGVAIQWGDSDTGWSVDSNLISAAGWAFNGGPGTKNSSFTGNRFVRVSGAYGAASIPGSGISWSGNYWDDTGAVVNQ